MVASIESPIGMQDANAVVDSDEEVITAVVDLPTPVQRLRLVLHDDHQYMMRVLELEPSMSGEAFVEMLRGIHYQERSLLSRVCSSMLRGFCMQKLAVSSAVVVRLDPESQTYPQAVSVESAEVNVLLTKALFEIKLHHALSSGGSLSRHVSFALEEDQVDGREEKALLIGMVFSQTLACVWLGLALFASTAVGIGVGVLNHNALNGLGCATGLLALLTTIQALLVWRASNAR